MKNSRHRNRNPTILARGDPPLDAISQQRAHLQNIFENAAEIAEFVNEKCRPPPSERLSKISESFLKADTDFESYKHLRKREIFEIQQQQEQQRESSANTAYQQERLGRLQEMESKTAKKREKRQRRKQNMRSTEETEHRAEDPHAMCPERPSQDLQTK